VDSSHLAEQQIKAEAELRDADKRFRLWVAKYVGEESAKWMNLGSSTQIQTLLFGGFTSKKKVTKKATKATTKPKKGEEPAHLQPGSRCVPVPLNLL
jgi:hypothetical protein